MFPRRIVHQGVLLSPRVYSKYVGGEGSILVTQVEVDALENQGRPRQRSHTHYEH